MRSIGVRNINMIKKMVAYEIKWAKTAHPFDNISYSGITQTVKERIPPSVYGIWEGAFTQIENIISDELNNYAYGRA